MKFEYCAIYYNWETDHGRFSVSPPTKSDSDSSLHLSREVSGALNRLGADGWELISTTPVNTKVLYAIFKKATE